MDGSTEHADSLRVGPVPAVVYAALLGATTAGQLVGIGLDASIGSRGFWLPVLCSVVLEAVVGARMGAARAGGPLSSADSARVSVYYSAALVGLTVPLVVWVGLSRGPRPVPLAAPSAAVAFGWLAILVVATVLRWVLMVVLRPRPS